MSKEKIDPKSQSVSPESTAHRKVDPNELMARFTALMTEIIDHATAADKKLQSVLEKIEKRRVCSERKI